MSKEGGFRHGTEFTNFPCKFRGDAEDENWNYKVKLKTDGICNVVTQFGDELYQCKDPDVRARGQRVKVWSLLTSK